jgi:ABC-2 type transport system permease protein
MTILRAALDESRRVFLDWGVLLITVFAVVLYSFFYPVPYAPEVLRDVPVAVVDADRSAMSRTLVRMIDTHESLKVDATCGSMAEAESLVRQGRVAASVVIPKDLERDVLRGQRVRVAAHVDASYMLAYSYVLKGLLESAGTMSAGIEFARWRAAGKTAGAAMNARQPIVADLRPLFSPAGGYGTYVVPAVLVLVLQQTLIIGAGIAGGTRREQRATHGARGPVGPFAPVFDVIGRSIPYVLLYAANLWYCFGFVLPYQGYPVEGPPAAIAWLAVPFLLATTFLALALRGLFLRRESAVQALLFTSLPFVFLSGFSWPSEAVPHWLRTAAQFVPTTSAIPGFLRIARMGADLPDVAREAAMLWVLALVYFPLACWAEAAAARRKGGFPDVTGAES